MATNDSTQDESVRLQAERVVGAYNELRDGMRQWDYETTGDFPFGLFAELVTQIKGLANWLEPPEPGLTRDHELPDELQPAHALYEKLTNAGGSTTAEAITKYFKDADVGVAGDGDEFTVVLPNLTRRGLTREYALRRLHYILRGTEPVPEGGAE